MGPIEWLLVVEGIVLVVAGICGSTAYFSRPVNQDPDAFLRLMMGFWRTMVSRRPVLDPVGPVRVIEVDVEDDEPEVVSPTTQRPVTSMKTSRTADASPVLRGGEAVASVATCSFGVTVVPRSKSNDVVGREHDGLRITVSGAADDAVANKLVLAIVARELGVKPYQVTLTRGHFAAAKAVRIAGMSQDELENRLRRYPAV